MTLRDLARDVLARVGASRALVWALAAVALVAGLLVLRSCSRPAPAEVERAEVETVAAAQLDAVTLATTETARRVERVTERRPDGSSTTREVETERSSGTAAAVVRAVEVVRQVEVREVVKAAPRPRLRVELRAGWHRDDLAAALRVTPPALGVTGSVRVAGPLWLGVWVNRDDRLSAGVAIAGEW